MNRFFNLFLVVSLFWGASVQAKVVVAGHDATFKNYVRKELKAMREGKRGLACQVLVTRLDEAEAKTTIKPMTRDPSTWHPNDRKGKKSHVVAMDTKIRDSQRKKPTAALYYLHASRIDPNLSTYQLGTFVHELVKAVDLNTGQFSGDYVIREKRSAFFRNAWRDSFGYSLVEISNRLSTIEYQVAKVLGLIESKYSDDFPILNPHMGPYKNDPIELDVSGFQSFEIAPQTAQEDDLFYGRFRKGKSFIRITSIEDTEVFFRYGTLYKDEFQIFEAKIKRHLKGILVKTTDRGFDFEAFEGITQGEIEGDIEEFQFPEPIQ